jgi:dTDP-4-amino-4,6-dideoxygalactose transaminase
MAALLIGIKPGDEVIMPSYTFVSTANAFILRGAKIVFADSTGNNPNIDPEHVSALITERTKAIVVVHYAGVACDMDRILSLAASNNIFVIEDAAQAIDSAYRGRPLGSIGHLAAFSFHETKNIISGEGGMLVINDERFIERSEVIWEKGTNRAAFSRREVSKYNWIDIGSSFLPSEITAAFLLAQLEHLDEIQAARKTIWQKYFRNCQSLASRYEIGLPFVDEFATNNAHLFYLVMRNQPQRDAALKALQYRGVQAIFHYIPLHTSPFFKEHYAHVPPLPQAEKFGEGLIRLPLYIGLSEDQIDFVTEQLEAFLKDPVKLPSGA